MEPFLLLTLTCGGPLVVFGLVFGAGVWVGRNIQISRRTPQIVQRQARRDSDAIGYAPERRPRRVQS